MARQKKQIWLNTGLLTVGDGKAELVHQVQISDSGALHLFRWNEKLNRGQTITAQCVSQETKGKLLFVSFFMADGVACTLSIDLV